MKKNHSKSLLNTLLFTVCCSLLVFTGCTSETEESTEHSKTKTTIETPIAPPDSVAAIVEIDTSKAIIDDVAK